MKKKFFECKLYDNTELKSHVHHEVEIIYVIAGSGYIQMGKSQKELIENCFYIINADETYCFLQKKYVLYAKISLYMDQAREIVDMSNLIFLEGVTEKVPDEIKRKVKRNLVRIIRTEIDKESYADILLDGYYQELLYYLVKYFAVKMTDNFHKTYKTDEQRKKQINQYIYTHFRDPLSLHDLAQYLYLSDAYLSKYMKRIFGKNFLSYLKDIRIEQAKKDLKRNKNKAVLAIAFDNGFPNINSFNKTFQNKYGMTPTQYRKSIKERPLEDVKINTKEMKSILEHSMKILSVQEKERTEISAEKNVQVAVGDAREKRTYINHWSTCMNVGKAVDLLRADMQEQILYLKETLQIKYVRCWNIISKDLIYRKEKREKQYSYNFSKSDKVLEFLMKNHLKPFFQLSVKPNIVAKNLDEHVYFEEENIIFETLEQYTDFIRQWMEHLIFKFGTDEVNTWIFEIWRSRFTEKGVEAYYRLFESTYTQIKQYAGDVQIGGMGFELIQSEERLVDEIRSWNKRLVKPDFITAYVYPYNINGNNCIVDGRRVQNENYVMEWIDKLNRVMHENHMDMPLRITEWNFSISSRNVLHDSTFMAAYIVKNILATINQVDFMAYWSATDIEAEHFDTDALLYGGEGILNRNGIRKPSYYAFCFLNQLKKYILGKGENYIITGDGHDEYVILCYNYQHPDLLYYQKREDTQKAAQVGKLFEKGQVAEEKIWIENVENGIYRQEVRRVNCCYGSVQDEMIRGNFYYDTNPDELWYLKEICKPKVSRSRVRCMDNRLELRTDLEINEIQLINLKRS